MKPDLYTDEELDEGIIEEPFPTGHWREDHYNSTLDNLRRQLHLAERNAETWVAAYDKACLLAWISTLAAFALGCWIG